MNGITGEQPATGWYYHCVGGHALVILPSLN
jgi:hypothetical protein